MSRSSLIALVRCSFEGATNGAEAHGAPFRQERATVPKGGGPSASVSGSCRYATQHGRDQLAENWPALYKPEQGANLPAEELVGVERGADYGWPECYLDDTSSSRTSGTWNPFTAWVVPRSQLIWIATTTYNGPETCYNVPRERGVGGAGTSFMTPAPSMTALASAGRGGPPRNGTSSPSAA